MTYDDYLERQVDKHTREKMNYSNCCNAEISDDTDICPQCFEHCELIDEEQYLQDKAAEIGDPQMEERRDRNI